MDIKFANSIKKIFGKNINKNYKKLRFKGFSYNINILSDHLVLIGNKLVNL